MSATDSYLEREAPSLSDTTALEMLSSASTLSSTTLDLSRRNITLLPEEDFPFCPQLEVSKALQYIIYVVCSVYIWRVINCLVYRQVSLCSAHL